MSYGNVLEPHRRKLERAEAQVRALENELDGARRVMVALKRNLRLVSNAVEECQAVAARDKRSPQLTEPIRRWLMELAKLDVFGPPEAELVATSLGNPATGATIRQRLAKMTDLGALKKRGRGHYSVDRDVCGNLVGIEWALEGETEVELERRRHRAADEMVEIDNRIRDDREAGRVRRLQADRSLEIDTCVDLFGEPHKEQEIPSNAVKRSTDHDAT